MSRWTRPILALTVLGAAAATAQILPASAATAAGGSDPGPAAGSASARAASVPAQLHALDLFLGTWDCTATISYPGQPVTVNTLISRVHPVLGGAWYEFDGTELPSASNPHASRSRWVFGWDAADGSLTSLYYDDQETSGNETSRGWQDGRLVFTGPYVLAGYHLTNRDEFTSADHDHYTDHFYVQLGGVWTPVGQSVCSRG